MKSKAWEKTISPFTGSWSLAGSATYSERRLASIDWSHRPSMLQMCAGMCWACEEAGEIVGSTSAACTAPGASAV